MTDWQYSVSAHRYRDTRSGRFLSPSGSIALRDDFIARQQESLAGLAREMANGNMSIQEWSKAMRSQVKSTTGAQYLFGRGGRNSMTAADRTAVADLVKAQQSYLDGFVRDLVDGKLSEAQIAARAQLYMGASVLAAEKGKAASYAGLVLPAYPTQGSPCRSQCRCHWSISETDESYRCTWKLGGERNICAVCRSRAATWAPLVIPKPRRATVLELPGQNGYARRSA